MKCPRCSAELFNSSTFCPQCGFNHQQKLNYTAPENYVATNQERPTTFSYLPAGTPPWPTTVPQNIPGVVASASQSQPASQANFKVESKPRRSVGGILSVIAVLILAPIIGILITFATVGRSASHVTPSTKTTTSSASQQTKNATPATNTNTTHGQNVALPTPTSFKTAKDTNVNISLQYPADWTQDSPTQSTNGSSLNIASQDQIGINFSVIHLNDTTSGTVTNADQLNQTYIQSLTQFQNVHNIQNVQAVNTQPSIAGAQWIEKDATFLDGSNNKIHFATISVQHGKSYYIIYFFIPDGIYTEAMKKYIVPMLNSVKFLS